MSSDGTRESYSRWQRFSAPRERHSYGSVSRRRPGPSLRTPCHEYVALFVDGHGEARRHEYCGVELLNDDGAVLRLGSDIAAAADARDVPSVPFAEVGAPLAGGDRSLVGEMQLCRHAWRVRHSARHEM